MGRNFKNTWFIILFLCSVAFGTRGDIELSPDGAKVIWNNNSQTTSLAASSTTSESVNYILPAFDGDPSQTLITDGFGVLSFADVNAVAGTHKLLSVTHTDAAGEDVTRGSIIYGNSTPLWDELLIGIATTFLKSDGTDIAWDAIDLGTDTTGDYVASITDGDNGIDGGDGGSESAALTLSFDSTELDALTWSDGSNASNQWTFDVSGTDHTMTAGSGVMTFSDNVTATGTIAATNLTATSAFALLPDGVVIAGNIITTVGAGGNDLVLQADTGKSVVINDDWTAVGQTCANLGTVSAATSITSAILTDGTLTITGGDLTTTGSLFAPRLSSTGDLFLGAGGGDQLRLTTSVFRGEIGGSINLGDVGHPFKNLHLSEDAIVTGDGSFGGTLAVGLTLPISGRQAEFRNSSGDSGILISTDETLNRTGLIQFTNGDGTTSADVFADILTTITQADPGTLKGSMQLRTNQGDSVVTVLTLTDAGGGVFAGTLGAGNTTVNGTLTVDNSAIKSLLIRQNSDGGDVLTVDTTTGGVGIVGNSLDEIVFTSADGISGDTAGKNFLFTSGDGFTDASPGTGGVLLITSGDGGATTNGTAANAGGFGFVSGDGGALTSVTGSSAGTSGIGGIFSFEAGAGGTVTGVGTTTGNVEGGTGAGLAFTGGAGGQTLASSVSNVGGNGGSIEFAAGAGGIGFPGVGGNGGNVILNTGLGAFGDTLGVNGNIVLKIAGTNVVIIDEDKNTLIGTPGVTDLIIEADGDTYWTGDGTGLPYGHMYVDGTQAIRVALTLNTPTEIEDDGTTSAEDGWLAGDLNLITFPTGGTEHHITITKPGEYSINWNISFKMVTGAANTQIHGGLTVDSTTFIRDKCEGHRTISNNTDTGNMSGSCLIDLPNGNEELSLWMENTTNSNDADVVHGSLVAFMVGGT